MNNYISGIEPREFIKHGKKRIFLFTFLIFLLCGITSAYGADIQSNWAWGLDQQSDPAYPTYPARRPILTGEDLPAHIKVNGNTGNDYDPVARLRVIVNIGTLYGNVPVSLFFRECTNTGSGGSACDAESPVWTQVAAQDDTTGTLFKFRESSIASITNGSSINWLSSQVPQNLRLLTGHPSSNNGCYVEGGIGLNSATCNLSATGYTELDFSLEYAGPAPTSSRLFEFIVAIYDGTQWVLAGYSSTDSNEGALLYVEPPERFTSIWNPQGVVSSTWTNGTNGYASDDLYATASSTATVVYNYGTSGLGIPSGSVIDKILVGGEFYTTGNNTITIEISWDGGVSWSVPQNPAYIFSTSSTACTSSNCIIIGSGGEERAQYVDVTSATTWTPSLLNSNNLQVRITYSNQVMGSGTHYLDWVPIMVTFRNSAPGVPTLDAPADGATQVSITPQLKTTTTDPEGNLIQYKIELALDSAFTTGLQVFDQTVNATGWSGMDAGSAYNSGTQATYTIQTPLTECTDYYWRSYAIDASVIGYGELWSQTQSTPFHFRTSCFEITTTILPSGHQWLSYSATLTATGGTPPYSNWQVVTGALPDGLTLDPNTGVISGVPTGIEPTETVTFTIQVSDSATRTATKTLSITIYKLSSISVAPVNPVITPGQTVQFTATGLYTDNSSTDITSIVTWSSSNTAVATIDATGLATGVGVGTVTISATK